MKRISSKFTFYWKRVFPLLWFGFWVIFIGNLLTSDLPTQLLPVLIVPCLIGVLGYFVMKKLILDLVDEVSDCGDHLQIRNGGVEERVLLSEIMNVLVAVSLTGLTRISSPLTVIL